jgi:hypothetical protein
MTTVRAVVNKIDDLERICKEINRVAQTQRENENNIQSLILAEKYLREYQGILNSSLSHGKVTIEIERYR